MKGEMMIYFSRNVRILAKGDREFTIQRRYKPIEGKYAGTVQWKVCGYYGRLDQAANALLEKELCETEGNQNAKTLIEVLRQMNARLESVCGSARAVMASTKPRPPELHVPPEPEDLVQLG